MKIIIENSKIYQSNQEFIFLTPLKLVTVFHNMLVVHQKSVILFIYCLVNEIASAEQNLDNNI